MERLKVDTRAVDGDSGRREGGIEAVRPRGSFGVRGAVEGAETEFETDRQRRGGTAFATARDFAFGPAE